MKLSKSWEITRTTYSIADFLSWMRGGELELSPSFQRRSVWKKAQKSYLIDSIYRGLPIPIIFLRERTDVNTLSTVREVIDGQQRLRTALSFIEPSCLEDFNDNDDFLVERKHNKEIATKKFTDFSDARRGKIISYAFSVHVLPSDTSDADVLNIFARMNSTGSKLNQQELRNAKWFGEFKNLSYDLAHSQLERWRAWKVFSESDIARMKEVEFTSELLIHSLDGIGEQTSARIDRYYEEYDDIFNEGDDVKKNVINVLDEIENHFGREIATSAFANKTYFYILFAVLSDMINSKEDITRAKKRSILAAGEKISEREGLPDDVKTAVESRSNRLSNRKSIYNFIASHVGRPKV